MFGKILIKYIKYCITIKTFYYYFDSGFILLGSKSIPKPKRVNIALGKPVIQSSVQPGFIPQRLTDGSHVTKFQTGDTCIRTNSPNTENQAWVRIDFEESKTVSQVSQSFVFSLVFLSEM